MSSTNQNFIELSDLDQELSSFARDVFAGLSSTPKYLSSRYFYDKRGSEIFQEIMRMPEYYPTDCEYQIFELHKQTILDIIGKQAFHLLEFGAGDGLKTKILLQHFLQEKAHFEYMPIDISGDALKKLEKDLTAKWPELEVDAQEGEYFATLDQVGQRDDLCKFVLFLGSNIGNFVWDEAINFLSELRKHLTVNDYILIGFDLKKDPRTILNAYNDPAGITKEFNINLLRRINRELNANFVPEQFMHYPTYNPLTGETKSYIVSCKDQSVHIGAVNEEFHFKAWEPIWTELSLKYDEKMIHDLAKASGFEVVTNLSDKRNYFVDSIWRPSA